MNWASNFFCIHRIVQIKRPANFSCFQISRECLHEKKFKPNGKVIAETEDYFDEKEKPFHKSFIKKLENRYTRCIALKGNYVE